MAQMNLSTEKKLMDMENRLVVVKQLTRCCFLEKYTCTRMFIAALNTIAKTWNQPKCPLIDDWIRKMWYICTMEYYSAIKNNDIMPFTATWMELETLILSEVSQRKTNTIPYHLDLDSNIRHK